MRRAVVAFLLVLCSVTAGEYFPPLCPDGSTPFYRYPEVDSDSSWSLNPDGEQPLTNITHPYSDYTYVQV